MRHHPTKIALVTWFGGPNLGNNLQVYALIRILESMGMKAELLKLCINPEKKHSIKNHLYLCVHNFFHWRDYSAVTPKAFANPGKYERVKTFAQMFIPVHCIKSHSALRNISRHYDIFITGSDQIWNPYYLKPFYLLDFVHRKTKISYSSSIGVDNVPDELKPLYIRHLKSFKYLSVREQTSQTLLRELLHREDVVTVVDPVLLLDKARWSEFTEYADSRCDNISKESFIFCYTVGTNNEYADQIRTIQQRYGINRLYFVSATEQPNQAIEGVSMEWIGPVEFVWMIRNASIVITDSYHCTCLSILFEKNFVELLRFRMDDCRSQNSRLFHLFDCLAIPNRFFVLSDNWQQPVNYQMVSAKLEAMREYSLHYLKTSIS